MSFGLDNYKTFIEKLCYEHNVKKLFLFGSALNEKFNNNSDIDFVVDFMEMPHELYADNYYDLKFSLESLFHRKVDLLEEQAIKNPYFKKSIVSTRQLIYGCYKTS